MRNRHYAWVILAACCALNFGLGMTINCAGQYFQVVATDLGVGMGKLTLYLTVRGLCLALAAPIVGRVLERANTRWVVAASFAVVLGCTAAMGLFTQVWQWYLTGGIMGLAGAFSFLQVTPILLNNWFARRTGFAVGLAFVFSGLGGALFNPLLAMLIQSLGWRISYGINAAAAAVIVLPATLLLVYQPADKGMKPYGWQRGDAPAKKSLHSTEAGGTVGRRGGLFACLFLVFGLVAFTACYAQQLSTYAVSAGYSLTFGGWLTSLSMVGNITGKLALGSINDRFGARTMTLFGMVVVAAAFLLLLDSGRTAMVYVGSFLLGTGMSMTSVASPLLARDLFGTQRYSLVLSRLSFGQSLLSALGIPIIGVLYDATGSFFYSLLLGIVCCAAVCGLTALAFVFAEPHSSAD